MNEDGEWQDTEDAIQNIIVRYFENIFASVNQQEQLCDRVVFKRITTEQSCMLKQKVTMLEFAE